MSRGCVISVAIEELDDTLEDAVDVMLDGVFVEVLDPFVAEPCVAEAVWTADVSLSSSSSSSSRFFASFPKLSNIDCILFTSCGSSSRSLVTSSKPLLRHPRIFIMSKILTPSRQASS